MEIKSRIQFLASLANKIESLTEEEKEELVFRSQNENAWFDDKSINKALEGVLSLLSVDSLQQFADKYDLNKVTGKRIGLVCAGNIPGVGFHDLLCVLISGNIAVIKLSSEDTYFMKFLIDGLKKISEEFDGLIEVVDRLVVEKLDAVIATGSDNTARYFEKYFSTVPNVIRKNRTSVAVISGNETKEDFIAFGNDVFAYYGLGCRNISKVLVPEAYDFVPMLDQLQPYFQSITHHKYSNNYDYNKSVYLVNKVKHLDTGFLLLTENESLVSPISVLFYETYKTEGELNNFLVNNAEKIQCVVGKDDSKYIPFGQAQSPGVFDYADGVDTIEFINSL